MQKSMKDDFQNRSGESTDEPIWDERRDQLLIRAIFLLSALTLVTVIVQLARIEASPDQPEMEQGSDSLKEPRGLTKSRPGERPQVVVAKSPQVIEIERSIHESPAAYFVANVADKKKAFKEDRIVAIILSVENSKILADHEILDWFAENCGRQALPCVIMLSEYVDSAGEKFEQLGAKLLVLTAQDGEVPKNRSGVMKDRSGTIALVSETSVLYSYKSSDASLLMTNLSAIHAIASPLVDLISGARNQTVRDLPPVPANTSRSDILRQTLPSVRLQDIKAEITPAKKDTDFTRFGDSWIVKEARGKAMVLSFWATYCLPCIKEFPLLADLESKYKESVVFVSLADDTRTDEKLIQTKMRLKNFLDDRKSLQHQYLLRDMAMAKLIFLGDARASRQVALPAFAIFDKSGILQSRLVGSIEDEANMSRFLAGIESATRLTGN